MFRFNYLYLLVFFPLTAIASPIIEIDDRLEINWSTLRIRFYGQAFCSEADGGYKVAEKKAWQDGISYLQEAIRRLNTRTGSNQTNSEKPKANELKEALSAAVKSTSSYNTTYFADGTVRVILENQLPRSLVKGGVRFRQKEPSAFASLQYTGLGLRLSKGVKPSPQYMILDENGAVLFEVQDMAEEAYHRNLMGRWIQRPSSVELSEIIGNNPAMLDAIVLGDGKFQVERAQWDAALEGHRTLLVNGIVALIQP